jgi:ParB family transcriptional regulator, chromosome partitioning protein
MNAPSLTIGNLKTIGLDTIDSNGPFQQRRSKVAAEADAGLAESIRTLGLLQPILVRWKEETQEYQVVDGHRRLAAARALGLESIKAVEVATDDRVTMAAGVAANHQRAALAPVDLWRAMVHLQDLGWKIEGAAMALGIPMRLARQLDKLGRLHPDMIAAIELGEMPEEDELATIAGAPQDVQAKALALPKAWYQSPKGGKVPNWYAMSEACVMRRIPQSRAIFDVKAIDLAWDEDLFAQADDPDRFTTTDVEGFVTAQIAALTARTKRGKLRSVEWDRKAQGPRLPSGWTRAWDKKAVGAVRFAAVQPEGYSTGCIVEIYAVPPPEPAGRKTTAEPRKESPPAGEQGEAPGDDEAGQDGAEDTGGEEGDEAPIGGAIEAPATPKGRGPLTEKGRILVAQAKTTAIRCALRDRRDHDAAGILRALVLAIAGDNVQVLGDPASRYSRADFDDLAARLVKPDGTPRELDAADILQVAAEAAARMVVCAPTGQNGNESGPAAEWIGLALNAHRDLPRLDTPEILATATGDTLRDAARTAGLPVGGSSKALRDRLAGHVPDLRLPGSTFAAAGPEEPDPNGFKTCEGCDDPTGCARARECWATEGGEGE